MMAAKKPSDLPAEAASRETADRLALALEEVGFDVGRAFPVLCGVLDIDGSPAVLLGRVDAEVAGTLAAVLVRAAGLGVTARM
jgi:hypothetical protein